MDNHPQNKILYLILYYKVIITFSSILGGFVSIFYLLFLPPKYEAIGLVQVAQLITPNTTDYYGGKSNLEDPNILITKMSSAGYVAVTNQFDAFCRLKNTPGLGIKFNYPKGLPRAVEFRVSGEDPKRVLECADAIYGEIQSSQELLRAPYLDELNKRLVFIKKTLKMDDAIAEGAGKNITLSLIQATKMNSLYEEMNAIDRSINSTFDIKAQLITPIYVVEMPKSSKPYPIIVFLGLVLGAIVGVIVAWGINFYNVNKIKRHF